MAFINYLTRNLRIFLVVLSFTLLFLHNTPAQAKLLHNSKSATQKRYIILFIWDGLRPDSVTAKHTPNLNALKEQGVWFTDNHSSYPTLTMMNAATFATGDLSGKTGFYGNVLWDKTAKGPNSKGMPINFTNPVFTEDYQILRDLNQSQKNHPLLLAPTLLSLAQKNGLTTCAVGKSGAISLQDYQEQGGAHGILIDETHVYPLSLAKKLIKERYPIPILTLNRYPNANLKLPKNNGNPTLFGTIETLKKISGKYPDGKTSDPTATHASPYIQSNAYLMHTYIDQVMTKKMPQLSIIWLRDPDTTEHNYGVGSPSYFTALHKQDKLLGKLISQLKKQNLYANTDLIIASDHAHSNTSGPIDKFPLRNIKNGELSGIDPNGFSVSGYFRPADLLTRAGFKAFDGEDCRYDPVLSGIKADGSHLYPIRKDKKHLCPNASPRNLLPQDLYTTPAYKVPKNLPKEAIVIANNGASTYFYVVNHDLDVVKSLVRFVQSREEFGPVFVDDRYNSVAGTLPMSLIKVLNVKKRNPDVIASNHFDDNAKISDMAGIDFNNAGFNDRGTHGSFSRTNVHNTLLAVGPDFKTNFADPLPSANIDVAPTIAYLLHLSLENVDGRPLLEALKAGKTVKDYSVAVRHIKPKKIAKNLKMQLCTDPDGKDIDSTKNKYTMDLKIKELTYGKNIYNYFDTAKETRF